MRKVLESAQSPEPQDVPNVTERLSQEVQVGIRHQSALAPFVDSNIPGARETHLKVYEKIDLLDLTKNWLYNQQAMRLIVDVKTQSREMPTMDKLESLADIREERLLPYIAKQFNEAWESAFNDCKTDEDKIKALKLRVLRRPPP